MTLPPPNRSTTIPGVSMGYRAAHRTLGDGRVPVVSRPGGPADRNRVAGVVRRSHVVPGDPDDSDVIVAEKYSSIAIFGQNI
jgi:hypothetical protein